MDRVKVLLGQSQPPPRAVIIGGCRTPFARSFGSLAEVDAIGLGVTAVRGLLDRYPIDPAQIDDVIWGNVVVNSAAPNIAREIVLDLNLPRSIPGVTVSRACLSGLQAIEQAVALIESGHADIVVAGGSDSTSNGEMPLPRRLTRALGQYALGGGRKRGWSGVVELARQAGPVSGWVPKQTEVAERSTGRTMGFHSDLMAEINGVPRDEQDRWAARSHANASAAQRAGVLAQEIVGVRKEAAAGGGTAVVIDQDDIVRGAVDVNKMAQLEPAFRPAEQHGTVTAASSSSLTDGASAVLIMSAERARSLGPLFPQPHSHSCFPFFCLGFSPFDLVWTDSFFKRMLGSGVFTFPFLDAFFFMFRNVSVALSALDDFSELLIDREPLFVLFFVGCAGLPADISMVSFATCAVDPYPQLLIAPAYAIPRALKQAGITLSDIDLFEIHEAFAAQVLSTLRLIESAEFAKEHFGSVTTIPRDRINPNGGSIAIGHPFAATGGRLVISACNQLRRTGKRFALLSICAAGGIGGVAILERQ